MFQLIHAVGLFIGTLKVTDFMNSLKYQIILNHFKICRPQPEHRQ